MGGSYYAMPALLAGIAIPDGIEPLDGKAPLDGISK